jgi:hypothetical protein
MRGSGPFFGSSRITGACALAFSHVGAASAAMARWPHTWTSRGETLVPTLAAQTVLRVRKGRPLRGSCSYWPTAAPLVRNSPRGWTPRSLTTIRLAGRRAGAGVAVEAGRHGRHAGTYIPARWATSSPLRRLARTIATGGLVERLTMAMTRQPERRCFVRSTRTNLRVQESLRCPPSRRVPDKWSGRRPNKYMSRGSGLPVRNAEGCLSSEGGHRRLCALPASHRRLCAVTSGPAEGKHRR